MPPKLARHGAMANIPVTPDQPSTPAPSDFNDRMGTLEQQLVTLLDRQNILEAENSDLRRRLAESVPLPQTQTLGPLNQQDQNVESGDNDDRLREQSLVPTHISSTSSQGRSSEPKVYQPEYYYGQRNKLTTFITQVSMVITLQPSRFTTEQSKIFYMGSFLRDTAFLWFQPYAVADPAPSFMESYHGFCAELKRTFGDPDEVGTAERQLYSLRQKTSVAAYVADFTRYSVIVKWNEEAKASQFYRGLKDNIKDELSKVDKPTTLKGLQTTAIRIDTRLFERQVERGEHRNSTTSTGQARFGSRTGPLIRGVPTTQQTFHQAFASQNNFTRRGKLTPSEYQRRKDNQLCLYCGEKGHQVAQCPVAPTRSVNFKAAVSQSKFNKPKPNARPAKE